ncbi:HAMP domain-containing methyl-accepting chemotaxis protein [Agrobacterium larrymoorei]|uniref:Methyl-accepting chemotaxis protein n=1 Tax=Agrobacterium larrymoorei TaxID=160699 RepID=A0ABU0UJS5_9HYPH|nr:methyl-accepting chemotaxis protein [Agrobacterium larrymoorei]MDQ1185203.1 methyl-accepting chemotaxis protein [Agrobacterium larrymoorei]
MKLSIGKVLAALSGVMILVAGVQGISSIISMSQIEDGIGVIVRERVSGFIVIGAINADIGSIRNAQSAIVIADPDARANFQADLAKAESALAARVKEYQEYLVDDADKQNFENFNARWAAAESKWTQVQALVDANRIDEARSMFAGSALAAYNQAKSTLQDAVNDIEADVRREGNVTVSTAGSAITLNYIALALALTIGLGAAVFGNRYIARPLVQMTGVMLKLSLGDTQIDIPGRRRKDEIGSMADAVEVFRQSAIENKRLEAEAEQNRTRAESERLEAQQKAEAEERLRVATSGLAAGLRRLASGDLAFRLNEKFAPDFEPLRNDFNQSIQQLGNTLMEISRAIETMNSGTREIAEGASDLSRRTEQQAATLEQTAAALDEITVNVANSTKRAQEATGAASEANRAAKVSGDVVAAAVDAMQRIEQSSGQISNIIVVIDEIAFQTNLLALNAGVEAARAGEAGKGFAVVAQEVRELAQRSARAAKEIKELIGKSSHEVENGVKLVQQTGEALKAISHHVEAVNEHMGAIATSSQEQATGLTEVNTAVNQMDQTTQQNAALVEETTTATSALATESDKLRALLEQFKLADHAQRGDGRDSDMRLAG